MIETWSTRLRDEADDKPAIPREASADPQAVRTAMEK